MRAVTRIDQGKPNTEDFMMVNRKIVAEKDNNLASKIK